MDIILKRLFSFMVVLFVGVSMFAGGTIKNVKKKAVDTQMTDETAALLYNIHQIQGKGTMLGQHDGVWMEEGKKITGHIHKLSGRLPAIASYDFMFITNVNNTEGSWFRIREHEIRERIIAANREGLFITMCWHYNDPYTQKTFYTKELPIEELKMMSFKSILPGGQNHERYKKDLRKVAEFSSSLRDDDGKLIPFIFRPFHEFDGEWFWWGAAYNEPEEFKDLWRFTVHYLRDILNVHNMLYAFSPDIKFDSREDYLLRYPGDDYVDILGFIKKDNPQKVDIKRMEYLLETISDMYEYLSYAVFWGNGGGVYCVPTQGDAGEEEFKSFLGQPFILLNDNK